MALPKTVSKEPLWYVRSIPYGQYLQSRRWKWFREQYIEDLKENGELRCERCGIETIGKKQVEYDGEDGQRYLRVEDEQPQWNLHHKTYERLGEETFEDVELLCLMCHNLEHYPDSHAARRWVEYLQDRAYLNHLIDRAEKGV